VALFQAPRLEDIVGECLGLLYGSLFVSVIVLSCDHTL